MMPAFRRVLTVGSLGCALAMRLDAQATIPPEPPLSRPVLVGAGIGIGGFLAGALVGQAFKDCDRFAEDDFCGLPEAFYGAAVGGTLGLAIGVNLGNRRRGSLPLDFLTGAAIWGVGVGAVALNSDSETLIWAMFAVVPVAQLVSTVAVERATGRARERRQGISFSVAPRRGGGITLRLGMPLPHLGG